MGVPPGFPAGSANLYSGSNVFQLPKMGSDGLNCTIR